MEFFINVVTFFILKVFPVIALGFAYVYAGVTFSPFPVLESSAKSKAFKILKEHYPDTKLNYVVRSRSSGMITSYREFEINVRHNDKVVMFWRIPYEAFTKENLNPAPTFDDVKAKVNRVLKEVNLDSQYQLLSVNQAYNNAAKSEEINAFGIKLLDKVNGQVTGFKFIYMYEINPKKFLKWKEDEDFENDFAKKMTQKFGSTDPKLMEVRAKVEKIFKEHFPNSPYVPTKVKKEYNSNKGDVRIFLLDTRFTEREVSKEKVLNSKNITVDDFEYWYKDGKDLKEEKAEIKPESITLPRSKELYYYTSDTYNWNKKFDLDRLLEKTILNPLIMEDVLEVENQLFHKQRPPQDKKILEKLLKKGEDTNSLTKQFRMYIYFHILRGGNMPQATTDEELGILLFAHEEIKKYSHYDINAMNISHLKISLFFSNYANSDNTNDYPLYLKNHKKLYELDLVLQQLISSNTLVENFRDTATYAQDNELCESILAVFRVLHYEIKQTDRELFIALVSVLLQNEKYKELILKELVLNSKTFDKEYHKNTFPTIKAISESLDEKEN